IGGVPENFGESARLGTTPFFVIEADEYDTAFSDKRSKFVHYRPRTLVLNNLEFDHADIFADLAAIQTQFHHLLKIVPNNGLILHNSHSQALDEVIDKGCWSETASFSVTSADSDWSCEKITADASEFVVQHKSKNYPVKWPLIGDHNMANAIAALAAAQHVGIPIENAVESLTSFKSVKRRMELRYENEKVKVYDDFAHHPTAIHETLYALRQNVPDETIIAVLEPRSNTMKQGVHKDLLANSLQFANISMVYADNDVIWDVSDLQSESILTFDDTQLLLESLLKAVDNTAQRCNIIIMSNGGFENMHNRLIEKLKLL
ncbi:UNVERIFIED_CONTAM: hypothetical protein GTU68_034487, partial [Idotea baltica]|nr:hypothetical protein [Idotea baltica]